MHPIEHIINYRFKTQSLLISALTHPSAGKDHYQRLEFLGDRVLGLMIAEHLMHQNYTQGQMAQHLSHLTSKQHLTRLGLHLSMFPHIRTALPKDQRMKAMPSLLSDVLEALMGAVFLDANYATAYEVFIPKLLDPSLGHTGEQNAKNKLQEWTQKNTHSLPLYRVVGETEQGFTVECIVPPYPPTYATAAQKRNAELIAAQQMLTYIGTHS